MHTSWPRACRGPGVLVFQRSTAVSSSKAVQGGTPDVTSGEMGCHSRGSRAVALARGLSAHLLAPPGVTRTGGPRASQRGAGQSSHREEAAAPGANDSLRAVLVPGVHTGGAGAR